VTGGSLHHLAGGSATGQRRDGIGVGQRGRLTLEDALDRAGVEAAIVLGSVGSGAEGGFTEAVAQAQQGAQVDGDGVPGEDGGDGVACAADREGGVAIDDACGRLVHGKGRVRQPNEEGGLLVGPEPVPRMSHAPRRLIQILTDGQGQDEGHNHQRAPLCLVLSSAATALWAATGYDLLLRKSGEFFYPTRMTKILVALAFVLGVVLGGLSTWVHSYGSSRPTDKQAPPISAILKSTPVGISAANDHCEARFGHTVGEVLGGILEAGLGDNRNPYSYFCSNGMCRLGVGNCRPWQKSDCGQTMLEFQVDARGVPRPETFACADIP
jgi:hypothetical protein